MSRSKSTAAKSDGANRQNRRALVTTGHHSIKAILLLGTACTLAAQPSTVSGRVANLLTTSPVRKAQVILNPGNRIAITDTEGRYALAGIAPGRYKLSVERPGFLPVVYGAHGPNRPGKTLVIAAGETRTNIDFMLEPPAVITGHIYDEDGEPLSSSVQVWKEKYRNGHRELDLAAGANADDEGQYRVYGLPAGHYYIASAQTPAGAGLVHLREVYAQTFYPGTEEVSGATALSLAPGGEARDIDFHLRKTAAVTVALEIEGVIAPHQNVAITMEGRDRKTVLRGNTSAGEFRIARVTPGSYTVAATSQVEDQLYVANATVNVGTSDVEGVRLTLTPALTVAGMLRSDANPTALMVILFNSERRVTARPSADGKFTWKNMYPGTWRLLVDGIPDSVYLKTARDIEITAETQKPIEIVLSSDSASVEGKVANPNPVEGATVLLIADSVVKFAISQADGKFALHGIAPGKYRLLAVDDLETESWNDPQVLKQFDGKGDVLELTAHQKAAKDLVSVQ